MYVWVLMIGRLLIMYGVIFFLVEHLFADSTSAQSINKGGARLEFSAGTQGEYGQHNDYQGKRLSWSALCP